MAEKKKKSIFEDDVIPEGVKKEDYADAAFKKRVTVIMSSVLVVFFVAVIAVLVGAWVSTEQHNKEFEKQEQVFNSEKDAVLEALEAIDAKGGEFEDRAQVTIKVTDENFSDWVATLDATYQLPKEDDGYAAFKGATIELEGMFYTRKFDVGAIQYWVYRYHSHDDQHEAHEHDHEGEIAVSEMIPIEVIFLDEDAAIPHDGEWVKVTGVVGPDSTKNLSAVRNAVVTVAQEHGNAHVE